MKKQQLVINSAHGFIRPIKHTAIKYHANYGMPEYGFNLNTNARKVINAALSENYTVFVNHADGRIFLARQHSNYLLNLENRQLTYLHGDYNFDEIVIDNITKVVRIWIDG